MVSVNAIPISGAFIKSKQTLPMPGADLSKFTNELPQIMAFFANLPEMQGLSFLLNGEAFKWKELPRPLLEITRKPEQAVTIQYALAVKEKNLLVPNHQNQIVLDNIVSKGKNPGTQQELAGRIAKAKKTNNPAELTAPIKLPPTADQLIAMAPNASMQGTRNISPEEKSVIEFVDKRWLCKAVLSGYLPTEKIDTAFARTGETA